MKYPAELKYTVKDEWVKVDNKEATIGISDYAQDQLSDVVYLEYAIAEGDAVSKGDILGTVESVKAASDIYLPVSGTVIAVNEGILDAPEIVNSDPYESGWMVKIELTDLSELEGMLDAAAYEAAKKESDA